jgi:hypothetical protein
MQIIVFSHQQAGHCVSLGFLHVGDDVVVFLTHRIRLALVRCQYLITMISDKSRMHRSPRDQPAAMIKVAIVGTNGLAQFIAHSIATTTSHQVVILSRRVCLVFCGS